VSIENLGSTDLKLLPPPRFVLNFPNNIIEISGMYSMIIVSLRNIPDPLTIGDLAKEYKNKENNHSTCQSTGPAHPSTIILYLFIYRRNFRLSLAVSFHRHRRRRRPMTTIPTRLARAATVSTSSVQQRKRVLDLYREWIRGVRSFYFLRLPGLTFLPSCHFPTTHHRHPKSARYIPSTSRRLQCAPLFATALRRIATCPTRR
jgi:hypothetical protein